MLILKAYKFQLMPNGEQQRDMRRFAGLARKLWNLALARQEAEHAAGAKYSNAFSMNQWVKDWKAQYPYLKDAPS